MIKTKQPIFRFKNEDGTETAIALNGLVNPNKYQKTIYAWKFPKNADKVFIGYGENMTEHMLISKDGLECDVYQGTPTNPLYLLQRESNGKYIIFKPNSNNENVEDRLRDYGIPIAKPVTMRSVRQDFLKQIKIDGTNDFDEITK